MRHWLHHQWPDQHDGGFDFRVHHPPCLRLRRLFQVQRHHGLLLLSGLDLAPGAPATVLFGLAAGSYHLEEACQCRTSTRLGL